MSLYIPDNFTLYQVSHDTSELIKLLLEAVAKRGTRVDASLLKRAQEILASVELGGDDREFIRDLTARLMHGERAEATWDDLAHALRILSSVDLSLRSLVAADEVAGPTETGRARFEHLARAFGLQEDLASKRDREKRHRLLVEVLERRPGLYVAELYKELLALQRVQVTYTTIWSDVKSLEGHELITIGGPQGTPRYCFPHPRIVRNRRAYYGSFLAIEGVVQERITNLFAPTKSFVDLFLVNSSVKPLILVTKLGVTQKDILGARVKTFGKLHDFGYLQKEQRLRPVERVESHDVLRVFTLTQLRNDTEELVWHDAEAFEGLSLYPGSSAAAM